MSAVDAVDAVDADERTVVDAVVVDDELAVAQCNSV